MSLGGKAEIGHIFNDFYFSGIVATNDDGSKLWKRQSFLFSPLVGIHGELRYKVLLFSVGFQFQRSGRSYKEELRNFTDYNSVSNTTSFISHKFLFNKYCFPISIGIWSKRKIPSESIFIGFRPYINTKAEFKSVERIKNSNTNYDNTLQFDILENDILETKMPKFDFQFFLGFSFPENKPFCFSLVAYIGKVYLFDNIRYQYQNYETKYVNVDGAISVKYNFNSNHKK